MKKPIIFAIDDDPQVIRAVSRDLRNQYKSNYRILSTTSANEALESLVELKIRGEEVALFLSDQKMPDMLGVEFLERAKKYYPKAKKALLTAYSDTDAAIKAINDVQLDYYLLKPWDPPTEKLYPVLDDLVDDWQAGYIPNFQGIKIIGYQYAPKSHEIKDFLAGNLIPYLWMDFLETKAEEIMTLNKISTNDLPVIILENGSILKNPTLQDIAANIGLNPNASSNLYDVVIIGAGPAGLAAAVYGGSEGLKTLLVEKRAPGGQAGTSSRIENYLGFPKGLSGADLSRRAITQATRFGVEFLSPQEVTDIELKNQYKIITLKDGNTVNAKSVVITSGVDYRKLPAENIDKFTGAGVYYGAATTEAGACVDKEVYIVGGGNSAGQGAMYLSQFAKNVYIVIRKKDLTSTMSSYLIDQISQTPNIKILGESEIIATEGGEKLESINLKNRNTNKVEKRKANALFVFIGAKPYTDWLKLGILKNERGFLLTGRDLVNKPEFKKSWKVEREPYMLETCVPGVFAAGDVRSGAMNRVASAVGEGAMSISFVHQYLAETL